MRNPPPEHCFAHPIGRTCHCKSGARPAIIGANQAY
jgi:hypothetical protein